MNLTTCNPFDDGEHILYVNGQYRGDDEIGNLMHDFNLFKIIGAVLSRKGSE